MLADYHVHTDYSEDSFYPMDDVALDAIRLNLDELCFTDHVDYGILADWDDPAPKPLSEVGKPRSNVRYETYFPHMEDLIERHADELVIKRGLEFGMQTCTIGKYERLFSTWGDHLDFVICSIHEVNNLELWTGEFQRGKSEEEFVLAYYEELLSVIERYKDYSVLGHLDAINRYDPEGPIAFDRVRDVVAAIFSQAIADGKGIEVNTSGIRYGQGWYHPARHFLELYRDLGGWIVTVGSDSHKPEHLGSYLKQAQRVLKDIGFGGVCTFDRMQPTLASF